MRYLIAALLLVCAIPAGSASPARDPDRTTNPEMTAIFVADQAARDSPATIDWKILRVADRTRRMRTQALFEKGALDSGEDFYHAAYIFQHGDDPEDFLKAHALAIVAVVRGKSDATWIAAATLDRYLQRIGKPQIYGTQFTHPPKQKWSQEPYRRDLLPDLIRKASGVPVLADQEKEREEWERELP